MTSLPPILNAGHAQPMLRLARAYGAPAAPAAPAATGASPLGSASGVSSVARAAQVRDEATLARVGPSAGVDSAASASTAGVNRLVAGVVPGRIDFSGEQPMPAPGSPIALYRHPADRNAAATGVHAGRLIDLEA